MREFVRRLPVGLSIPKVGLSPSRALSSVTSKTGRGVYASSDRLFKGAVFGRDSLEVAEDIMHVKPKLVQKIILTLASLQGEVNNKDNEEEPGKIIHEYRTPVVDGRPLDKTSRDIYDRLSAVWGGNDKELAYYGSVDSTPHFIKVVAVYCQTYGMEILVEQVTLRSGQKESVLGVIDNALGWLSRHLDKSHSGFVEYLRRNPDGIENQVWKDSREFYTHENGEPANHNRPISSIEVQALAYDALKNAAEIFPSLKGRLNRYANRLQKQTLGLLWLKESEYFALGTDYDEYNQLRIISTATANPAELLDSGIFDNLPQERKQRYISGLVREIMGTDYLTDAGIRSRALHEAKLFSYWDYHGSYVTWPKETYDIAKGLRRQGFPLLVRELENRLHNVVKAIRSYPEFIYVDSRGRVLGIPTATKTHGELLFLDSTNRPETVQAWTVSAIMAIQSRRGWSSQEEAEREVWRQELEKEVLQHIPLMPRLRSAKELSARYPYYPYELNGGKR